MRDVGHLPKNLTCATQGLSWIQNWTQFYKKDVFLNAMTEKLSRCAVYQMNASPVMEKRLTR
jgi:hypothetical protein